jgi:hypothetical protein
VAFIQDKNPIPKEQKPLWEQDFMKTFVRLEPVPDDVTEQVTQPVGYVGTLPAIRINESTAEWTARDCYVSLLGGGTVYMSTCETMAEWTIRDCRYEYV